MNILNKNLLVLLLSIFFVACSSDDDEEEVEVDPAIAEAQLVADIEIIDNYLDANNISAEIHESGMRYVIVEEGGGSRPNTRSRVTTAFVGMYLDGEVFDSSNNFVISLASVIQAWQIGLPLIKSGGAINLYVPSALAYGPGGNGTIPGNTVLIFEISLVGVE